MPVNTDMGRRFMWAGSFTIGCFTLERLSTDKIWIWKDTGDGMECDEAVLLAAIEKLYDEQF